MNSRPPKINVTSSGFTGGDFNANPALRPGVTNAWISISPSARVYSRTPSMRPLNSFES